MSEKQKMLKGELYDANNDESLKNERIVCKNLCFEFNSTQPTNIQHRENIIKKLFAKTGKSFLTFSTKSFISFLLLSKFAGHILLNIGMFLLADIILLSSVKYRGLMRVTLVFDIYAFGSIVDNLPS